MELTKRIADDLLKENHQLRTDLRDAIFIAEVLVNDYPTSIKELDEELYEMAQNFLNRPSIKALLNPNPIFAEIESSSVSTGTRVEVLKPWRRRDE